MEIKIDAELIEICKDILSLNYTLDQWDANGSSEMYQSDKYCGGYENRKNQFTFSLYEGEKEYWFQFLLNDVEKIINGEIKSLNGTLAS